MSVTISAERPDTPDAILLIAELEAVLDPHYPPESRHGLSVARLISEDVAFFVLRTEGTPAGCAGLMLAGTAYGEVKRMYVRSPFRGRGFAKVLLNRVADYARASGVDLLRLETGIHQSEAIRLYERMGFKRIPPFGSYHEDPLSLFYEKHLR
jgi:GNAT superfamily N-acetyltransferase